jgi:hypothetical protein
VNSLYTDRDDNAYISWQGKLFTGIEESYYDDGKLGRLTEPLYYPDVNN